MFEKFTEKARRVIFFARYEASQFGSRQIDCEHLMLGLVHEAKVLFASLPCGVVSREQAVEAMGLRPSGENVSTSEDLPLTHEAKRVLAYAAEESERLSEPIIDVKHVLLGLLHEASLAQKALLGWGLRLDEVRKLAAGVGRGNSLKILEELRASFAPVVARLRPEVEPAVTFLIEKGGRR